VTRTVKGLHFVTVRGVAHGEVPQPTAMPLPYQVDRARADIPRAKQQKFRDALKN